jgi:hypothetical protein
MAGTQFFHIRQFVQIPKPKMIQKKLRRFVKERTSGDFSAPSDSNQPALH